MPEQELGSASGSSLTKLVLNKFFNTASVSSCPCQAVAWLFPPPTDNVMGNLEKPFPRILVSLICG